MKPMDRDFIDKHDIAQRYLHGRLTPEEAEEFEVYLMDNPEMVEELEIDGLLKSRLPNSRSANSVKRGHTKYMDWFLSTPLRSIASTAAVCTLVFTMLPSPDSTPGVDLTRPTDLISLSVTRNSTGLPDASLSLSENTSTVILVIQAEQGEVDSYQVTVTNQTTKAVMTDEAFYTNSKGELFVPVKLANLESGIVSIDYMQPSSPESKRSYHLLIEP